MNTPVLLLLTTLFTGMIFFYWYLVFGLIDQLLEQSRMTKAYRLLLGVVNTAATVGAIYLANIPLLPVVVILLLMLLDYHLLYQDSAGKRLFCALACTIHVLATRSVVLGIFSVTTTHSVYELSHQTVWMMASQIIVFAVLDLAILLVRYCMPLDSVRIISSHKEHQWFMIAWMFINIVYLFINTTVFHKSADYLNPVIYQVIAPLVVLLGLYIVLFFAFKTSQLLGYKEKSAALEQSMAQEQQYRNSVTKDAIATYEINLTKNLLLSGLEDSRSELGNAREEMGEMIGTYSDVLAFMSRRWVYSADIQTFMRYAEADHLIGEYELGRSETTTEYRRLMPDGSYAWVRAVINLIQEMETGDLLAYICIKNIDTEKRRQLELQQRAERDPLTGLYNKEVTGKLIDEHLAFKSKGTGATIFMIDVDGFKEVNDHLGHIYGDAVLCELADKLRALFRSDDIVGRIGGDEFIAYMKNCTSVDRIRDKAEEVLKAFRLGYKDMEGEKHAISGSVGIAIFPKDGISFGQLYQRADIALYQVKRQGKNNWLFYGGGDFVGYASHRTEIETRGASLQRSFRNNRLEYVFKILYESENSVAAIHAVLELVAGHFSFERGYIFEISKDGKTASNTFEWCAEGISPQIDNLQELPIQVLQNASESFRQQGTFVVKSLDDLEPIERQVLEPQGIQSMFQFGIFDKNNLLGLIGFDNCKGGELPEGGEIDEIATICNLLSIFFVKQYIDRSAEDELVLFQEIMNNLENYIYVVNMHSFEVLFMNDKTRQLMQTSASAEPCYRFFRGKDCQCEDCPVRRLSESGVQKASIEAFNDNLGIWMETTATPLRWRDGTITALINCADITRQKQENLMHVDQLEKLAYVDELTGGRTYHKFREDARRLLIQRSEVAHLFVKLDIDNFKLFNQMYGYEMGDEVLRAVATALDCTLRGGFEICARVVNDEFIALFELQDTSEQTTLYEAFLEHFRRIVGEQYAFKFTFPHGRYILYPGDGTADVIAIFEKVNMAHKAAKQDRTRDFVDYDESITKNAISKKEIENKMEGALERGEFHAYLQPKYRLLDESVGGAEALARWRNDNADLFYPDAFIPVFEQNGFVTKLDLHILRQVCGLLRGWIDRGIEPVVVSVNFSRLHLNNPRFVQDLCDIVDGFEVPHKFIEIEITETVIYDNIETLQLLLEQLHAADFTMSMDDFGSGYSSLGMLKNLPVDVIKMDRSFFTTTADATRSKAVVRSVIEMAENLGIRIVAEGTETQEHVDLLRELHCAMAQGYFFAKPMPAAEFEALIAARP